MRTPTPTGGELGGAGAGDAARCHFAAADYDLATTLSCGQAFRWDPVPGSAAWVGVVGSRWVRLRSSLNGIEATAAVPVGAWAWLEDYLQTNLDLTAVLRSFPDDEPMRAAVAACRGLRLLRQEPWECLASFILSSSKQIVQIRQIIAVLCERYGSLLPVPFGYAPAYTFPTAARLAVLSEADLRGCKMGFRARYLQATARSVAEARCDLVRLADLPTDVARAELMLLPGVGRKIADCVLLFAYGRLEAFPIDVWMIRALGDLYFPRRRVSVERLHRFATSHFGPHAGFAQQYLFHYVRTAARDLKSGTE